MSEWQDAAKMLETAIKGIEMLQELTHVGGDKATGALKIIDAGLSTIADGLAGKTSPDLVMADLKSLTESLVSNDATADATLDKKFEPGNS